VVAGGFKRAEPEITEHYLLMRTLRDFNLPKFPNDDKTVFLGLLGDLFPGLNPTRKVDEEFGLLVKQACEENKLYPEPEFIDKCLQLREIMSIRHCTFIMGPAGSAKTRV